MVLPLVALGCTPDEPLNPATLPPDWTNSTSTNPTLARQALVYRQHVIFGRHLQPDVILLIIAIWKSILWIPCAALIFLWCRALYGLSSAWLVTTILLIEPTVAAHIPTAAVDIFSAEALVFMSFFAWRYFVVPRLWRLVLLTGAVASVMLIKNSGIIAPAIVLIVAIGHWFIHPLMRDTRWEAIRPTLRARLNTILLSGLLVIFWIWILLLFDVSRPRNFSWPLSYTNPHSFFATYVDPLFNRNWPAGLYIGSVIGAVQHSQSGHWAYLLGHHKIGGWWYYFPVVATFKIPIGIGIVMLAGLASLRRYRPRWEEWFILVPMLAWMAMLMASTINVGFRHMLPPYLLMLMLAGRCLAFPGIVWKTVAWLGTVAAAVHTISYHPDYLSYINFPRNKPYLSINDSNLDWGQSFKEIAHWIDEHPQGNRPIYFAYYFTSQPTNIWYYLGDRVQQITRTESPPTHGVLIISPIWVAGIYYESDNYGQLRDLDPGAVIGHSMLVYDLDKHAPPGEPFVWKSPIPRKIIGWNKSEQ